MMLFSDAGDGRFNNLLCEHWFQVFSGKAYINQLPTFYPISATLGYSDAMLMRDDTFIISHVGL